MREVTVGELGELLTEIEQVLAEEGTLVLTRHDKPVARISAPPARVRRSNADLRAMCPFQEVRSEVLIREDRDAGH